MEYATKAFVIKQVQDAAATTGDGDMLKSVYDTNGDGTVNSADSVSWTGVTGKPATYTPEAHTHTVSQITDMPAIPDQLSDLADDATHRTVTDTEKTAWSGKQDALGFTPVPDTRTINSKPLSSNVTLSASDVGAAASSHTHTASAVTDFDVEVSNNPDVAANTAARHTHSNKAALDLVSGTNTGDQDLSGLVPKTATVNGHALSANVTVTASDVGLGNVTNESKTTMLTDAALTGTPTAPTATSGTNTTQIATTAFVQSAVSAAGGGDMSKSTYDTHNKATDIFDYVDGKADKIGDIKTTARTDLGANWLLCNGDTFSPATYPALASVVGSRPTGTWTSNPQGTIGFEDVAYGNGYWVAVGSSGALYYKQDTPDGTWTQNKQGTQSLLSVSYANGYWVAVGLSGTLYYKADTPDGAWTSNTQGTMDLWSVAYGNGYWVAVGSEGALYYKANTPDGTWTSNPQGTGYFGGVFYGNGYWVAVGSSALLYYKASTPDGAWTSNSQNSASFIDVAYGNGYWVAVGLSGALYYKQDTPDGAWTSNTQGTGYWYGVMYGYGYWAIVGANGTLRYKDSTPDGAWTSNTQGTVTHKDIAYGNGVMVTVGMAGNLYFSTQHYLPTSSRGDAYEYIKAL